MDRWKNDPVTKELFETMQSYIDEVKKDWELGRYNDVNNGMLEQQFQLGKIQAFKSIISIEAGELESGSM